jgi:hypothetical protein
MPHLHYVVCGGILLHAEASPEVTIEGCKRNTSTNRETVEYSSWTKVEKKTPPKKIVQSAIIMSQSPADTIAFIGTYESILGPSPLG